MKSKTAVFVAAVGILVVVAVGSATQGNQSRLTGDVAGAPGYRWNQPFLDWPQTGDLPCTTEEGPCGPPDPTLDPADQAQGRPLRIARLDVPVGVSGRHDLELGQQVLPNGVHSRTFFRITNGDPAVYRVAQTHVEFRSLEPGAPRSRSSREIVLRSRTGARHRDPCLVRRPVGIGRDHDHRGLGGRVAFEG